jgi:6-phosphogluconolactonase (cycloisomerase 2 family)
MRSTLKHLPALLLTTFLMACSDHAGNAWVDPGFTVGGQLKGLGQGQVVTLKMVGNGGTWDYQEVSSNGSFTFGPLVRKGIPYEVTVEFQPRGLACTVNNGSGTMPTSNVTNVSVNCDTQGLMVYVTQEMNGTVAAYSIGSGTGDLTAVGSPIPTGTGEFPAPKGIAVSTSGQYAYVTNAGINTIIAYAVNSATGILTAMGSTSTQAGPEGVAVDPAGKFVYVAEPGANKVSSYAVNANTGLLAFATSATPEDSSRPVAAVSLAVAPSGNFVYYATGYPGSAGALRVDRTSGALTAASYWVGLSQTANQIVVHPNGTYVFVATGQYDQTTGHIVALSLNPITGKMTLSRQSNVVNINGVINGIAIDRYGRHLYAIDSKNNLIYSYDFDDIFGDLIQIGSAIATGKAPTGVTVDRGGKFVYVANGSSHTISVYAIGSYGGLTPIGTKSTGANTQPQAITSF